MYGGIEAGGTKWVCAVGTGPDDFVARTIPTTSPEETIGRAVAFFAEQPPVSALGIGSFGPVDLDPASPTWGFVTTTPKPGWAGADVAGELARGLGVPVAFDTDVNAAAVGEHRWGAARGLDTFCYVTVGTGIGGGGMAGGELLHGLLHPEVGHMRVPRDPADGFAGSCLFHGDCWEGLASGRAIEERWGMRGEDLVGRADVWELEAGYLALGLANLVVVLSPERVVAGGGVMEQPGLLVLVRRRVQELLGGYLPTPALETYIVPPELGRHAGVLGAIALAVRRYAA